VEPLDVTAAAGAVRAGEVSARELVEDSIDRIDRGDGALNTFVHLDPDGALAAADRIDGARRRGEPLGPLAGVPFGVKDLEDCAGMPTTRRSRWYADGPPASSDDLHVGDGSAPRAPSPTARPPRRTRSNLRPSTGRGGPSGQLLNVAVPNGVENRSHQMTTFGREARSTSDGIS